MKAYITFTRKKLLLCVLCLVCSLLICSEIYVAGNNSANALTNAERISFLKKLGYTVLCDEPTSKEVVLPDVFSDVYNNYNSLQKSAGYDLSLYKGCEVVIYSYGITPPEDHTGECLANIIVYNDRIIGGDISSAALGGFMLPLKS